MPFASISAVLFIPSLPEIATLFQISESTAQASMTLFLCGYAIGNIPYGPLAKRFGRKSAIYSGIAVTLLGCFLILLAGGYRNFSLFLLGRFISALGSSVGMKISFTIIGDAFEGPKATKVVSLATLAFAIAPGIAIALGGFLTVAFGWQSCFYALMVYSVAIAIFSFFLPETAPSLDRDALNPAKIRDAYVKKLKNSALLYGASMLGCVASIIYLFSTFSPFLGINRIGLSPEIYGLLNFIPPLGMIAGSFASHWLSTRLPPLSVTSVGIWVAIASTLTMFLPFLFGYVNAWTLFAPTPLIYFGTSLIFNNASSFAMAHMKDKATGSSVMGFLNMGIATISVWIAESISSPHPLLMPTFFLLLIAVIFALQMRLKKLF